MGDDEAAAVFHQRIQRELYFLFTAGVQGAGRLIQNQDVGIPQDGPRNGDALALPAGELHAALSDDGGETVGKGFDEREGVGLFRG